MNAYDIYFKLTGISDKNTKALFAKIYLSDTTHTWHDSLCYDVLEEPWLLAKWVRNRPQSILMILRSIWLIAEIFKSHHLSSYLKQIWLIGLAPWCFPVPATHCKKPCLVQNELDQCYIKNMYKICSNIKAYVGINLNGNATETQWQHSKLNNRNIQYSMKV